MPGDRSFAHGSPDVWDGVFEGLDLSYSETPRTQGKLFEIVKVQFLEKVLPKPPMRMLEVGCGSAFVSLYFAKRGYAATCVDRNPSILKQAEANFDREGTGGSFICCDAEKLPFASGEFDIVTSFGLLEHFEDPAPAIREMVRVIRRNGLFFADIVPARFSTQTLGSVPRGDRDGQRRPSRGVHHPGGFDRELHQRPVRGVQQSQLGLPTEWRPKPRPIHFCGRLRLGVRTGCDDRAFRGNNGASSL